MDMTTGVVNEQKSLAGTVNKMTSTINNNNNNSVSLSNNSTDLNNSKYTNELGAQSRVVDEVLEEIIAKVAAIAKSTQLNKTQHTQVTVEAVSSATTTTTITERVPSLSPDDEITSDLVIDSDLPSVEAQEPPLIQPDTEPLFGSLSAFESPIENNNATTTTANTAATTCLSGANSSESKSKTQIQTQTDEERQSIVTATAHASSDGSIKTIKKDDENKQSDEATITKKQQEQPEAKESQAVGQSAMAKRESITNQLGETVVDSNPSLQEAELVAQADAELVEEDVPLETKAGKVDMVELKNLTPNLTPQPPIDGAVSNSVTPATSTPSETPPVQGTSSRAKRRANSPGSASDMNDSTDNGGGESGGRLKRQRRQTNLFQAGDPLKPSLIKTPPKSNASLTSTRPKSSSKKPPPRNTRSRQPSGNQQNEKELEEDKPSVAHNESQFTQGSKDNVIYYEKFDFLAIRNEEKSFYLCQVQENVSVNKQTMKVRWFDTKDNDKTYYLTDLYDTIPQLSVLMPVTLDKSKADSKGKNQYFLSDSDRSIILDRLARSLNAAQPLSNSQTD